MSTFAGVVTPPLTAPDPSKHVNYTQGMVLGVDDFNQEFAYLDGHQHWLAHGLIGYGTVRGLRVTIDPTVPEVVVSAGNAVSPLGQLIRVPLAQCAKLNDWLAANQAALFARLGSPLGSPLGAETATLYVVLSYRACAADPVPIPGEPCRSEADSMAPSRLADDFCLELVLDPPDQHEEDALRDFLAALSQVQITNAPGAFASLAQFLAAVRAFGQSPGSPPTSPLGSSLAGLRIHTADAPEFFRAALRVWVTELRPPWTGGSGTPPEKRLLLAELDVPLKAPGPGGAWTVANAGGIVVNEERRPFLVPLRFLQEWLLYLEGSVGGSANPPVPTVPLDALTAVGTVVAAGQFAANGTPAFASGGLTALPLTAAPPLFLYLLLFPAFQATGKYVVKGTTLAAAASTGQVFHVVPAADAALVPGIFPAGRTKNSGIVVRAHQTTGNPAVVAAAPFAVEISQF